MFACGCCTNEGQTIEAVDAKPLSDGPFPGGPIIPVQGPKDTKQFKEFTVSITKTAGDSKIGMDISAEDKGKVLKVWRVKDGLVKAWNSTHPELEVHAGDGIISVNGVSGDAQAMLTEVSMKNNVTFVFAQGMFK
eukprot:TRINITY_DN112455_c0_g1_i1.p2 TRINITY_DN112455_c0_g1~~TRINITY_DN112455_c0_g1_i1.p2  ORF type:complete len:135 (-),score=27.31 TRINITY_DN112455_c0_g1_i1:82-486(-)